MPADDTQLTIGERLKDLRTAEGRRRGSPLRQKDIAAEIGVSEGTVAKWETNVHPPDGENLKNLARVLSTTPEYILHGDGAPARSASDVEEVEAVLAYLRRRDRLRRNVSALEAIHTVNSLYQAAKDDEHSRESVLLALEYAAEQVTALAQRVDALERGDAAGDAE